MKFLSGFESTHIFGSGKDVLQLTRHTDFFEQDLRLVESCGLDLLRYSAPWHTIEKHPGEFDWEWMDKAMACLQSLGIQPILDPLHHTSFPSWLADGFADARFCPAYFNFVKLLAERYPWARHYTIINEPFVTAFFCGHEAIWHPYRSGAKNFVPMILNVCEAICRISRRLIETVENVRFIHVDTCEQHRATDEETVAETVFRNEIRFLVHDLILGNVSTDHPLYFYLRKNGASDERLQWFRENAARIDVLGLDYYAHSELEWNRNGRIYPNRQPVGFAAVALDYVNRFPGLPVMLSETNIRGTVAERVTWLKFMVEQCERLETELQNRSTDFQGFCWYPFIDSTDWCSLVREANGRIDPQGIFCLGDGCRSRNASELSEVFAALAAGKITSKDIAAYGFEAELSETLKNYLPLVNHWNWKQPTI